MATIARLKGGICNSCGKPITDSDSAILYAVDTTVPHGKILALLDCHSIRSAAKFQTTSGAASGMAPKDCLDVVWRKLKGSQWSHCRQPGIKTAILDGNTIETIKFLKSAYKSWSQEALDCAGDILWCAVSGSLTPLTVPKKSGRLRSRSLQVDVKNLLREHKIVTAQPTPSCLLYQRLARSDRYRVSSACSGYSFNSSAQICEHYAKNGSDFLQAALDLSSITSLNWCMPNAIRFMERLLEKGYTVSQISRVVTALQNGYIGRPSGSGGSGRLHREIDQLLNPKYIQKRRV